MSRFDGVSAGALPKPEVVRSELSAAAGGAAASAATPTTATCRHVLPFDVAAVDLVPVTEPETLPDGYSVEWSDDYLKGEKPPAAGEWRLSLKMVHQLEGRTRTAHLVLREPDRDPKRVCELRVVLDRPAAPRLVRHARSPAGHFRTRPAPS